MYANSPTHGYISVFSGTGAKPLAYWDTHVKWGRFVRFVDRDINAMVLDVLGSNVSTTYMICPKDCKELAISMPFLVMVVKNLRKYFTFEIKIRDSTGAKRRFRVANFQSHVVVSTTETTMPICLTDGWNQIQFNLADFVHRVYHTEFINVIYLKINANIRLRTVYFTDKLRYDEDLPKEFRLFKPRPKTQGLRSRPSKEETAPCECPEEPLAEKKLPETETERQVSKDLFPKAPTNSQGSVRRSRTLSQQSERQSQQMEGKRSITSVGSKSRKSSKGSRESGTLPKTAIGDKSKTALEDEDASDKENQITTILSSARSETENLQNLSENAFNTVDVENAFNTVDVNQITETEANDEALATEETNTENET